MRRFILSVVTGTAFMLGGAFAQSAQTAPPTTGQEAEQHHDRMENQRDRIQQGVKSGNLTHQQARTLANQDRRLKGEAQNMKAKNGGKLSQGQESRINRQMNRQSRRIYRAKH